MRQSGSGSAATDAPWNSTTTNTYNLAGTSLYNGNISSWMSQHGYDAGVVPSYTTQPTGHTYAYDVLNRLKSAEFDKWYIDRCQTFQ